MDSDDIYYATLGVDVPHVNTPYVDVPYDELHVYVMHADVDTDINDYINTLPRDLMRKIEQVWTKEQWKA